MFNKLFKRPPPPPRDFAALLEKSRKPAVHLVAHPERSTTYLGGLPELPQAEDWPRRGSRPMAFIGQIDLATTQQCLEVEWLPKSGRLLFFYHMEDEPWGFDPADRDAWRVVYTTAPGQESPQPEDLSEDYRLNRVDLACQRVRVFPPVDREPAASLKLDAEEYYAYDEVRHAVYAGKPHHQVSGFPDCVQLDCMEEEAQLASNGLYCGDATGYQDARAATLRAGARDWRLLLQVDTDDDAGVMWGDCGLLYFWVKEQDAKRGDFSNVWVVLQCS